MTASARDRALDQLDDYVRGHTPDGQTDAQTDQYEHELFARALANDAPELTFYADMRATLREMAARGTLQLWLTARDVERMLGSGLRIRRYELDVANPQPPDLSGEFDILITKIPFDLSGIRRLDAEVFSASGQPLKRMPEIAFDPADGAVFACCEAELARAADTTHTVTRVYAVDDSGRRLLCEISSV